MVSFCIAATEGGCNVSRVGSRQLSDWDMGDIEWLRLAARDDFAYAQFLLGYEYEKGQRVLQNYQKAFKWYQTAANMGLADGQLQLAFMYEKGRSVPQDCLVAHMWFNLASARGSAIAAQARDEIAEKMTPAQVAEAQRLAREWMVKAKQ